MTTLPSDSEVRAKAVDVQRSVLLTAPAGSGKTSVLEQRYLRALANSDAPEQVVAITFTVAAAGEIRERALSALKAAKLGMPADSGHKQALYEDAQKVLKLDAEKGWGLLRDPSRMRIMTIDALNSLIATSLPLVSRSGGATQVDTQPHLLYREAVVNLFADLESPGVSDSLRDALSIVLEFGRHQIDRLIPLFESLLATRDQWLKPLMCGTLDQFESTFEAIISATKANAVQALQSEQWNELLGILREGSGYSENLAWAAEIEPDKGIDAQATSIVSATAASLLTTEGGLRKKVDKRQGFRAGKQYTERMNILLKGLAASVSKRSLTELSSLSRIPDFRFDGEGLETLEALSLVLLRLAAHLQVVFQNNGRVDFLEVHARAMTALNMDSDYHGDFLIREERIRHLLVDEMQDTSGSQIELIQALTGDWQDGDGRSLFMCGDPQQSIYAFRGADVGEFLTLWEAGRLGNKSFECLALTNNFRSSPELVNFYNGVFTNIFGSQSNRWTGQVPFSKADAFCLGSPGTVKCTPFEYKEGDALEARLVCDYLESELKKDPETEIAVLVRSRSHLKSILPLMRERGIPVSGEEIDHLTEKSAVSDCVSLIKAMAHLGDRASWLALLRAPFVGLTWQDCLALVGDDRDRSVRELLDDHKRLTTLSVDGRRRAFRLLAVIRRIELSDRWRDVVWRSRCLWESLGGLDVVDSHTASDVNRVFAVLAECTEAGHLISRTRFENRLARLFAAPTGGQVKVMTIHNAKGLEFDKICLVGLSKSTMQENPPLIHWRSVGNDFLLVPATRQKEGRLAEQYSFLGEMAQQSLMNEQRRLLYVALTRARAELHIFAGVKVTAKGEISAPKNTFMDMLLPYVDIAPGDVASEVAVGTDQSMGHYVKVRKVPSTYQGPCLEAGYRCVTPARRKPEDVVSDSILKRQPAAQRAAGTTFHYLMERIAKDGLSEWNPARIKEIRKPVIALLRRNGCPEGYLDRAVEAILRWTHNTITSSVGQWILKKREQTWYERKISGWRNGEFFSHILDITFVEGNTIWVIDYKSSLEANSSAEMLLETNREHIERNIDILRAQHPNHVVRGAVFVPMTPALVEHCQTAVAA